MNDDDLRALVRAAIQRHLSVQPPLRSAFAPPEAEALRRIEPAVAISFGQYKLERAADDTMCIIEPVVRCNHCGYCKCHGH